MANNEENKAAMAATLSAKEPEVEETSSLSSLEKEIAAAVEQAHVEATKKAKGEEPDPAAKGPDEEPEKVDEESAPDLEGGKRDEDAAVDEQPEGEQGRDEKGQFTRKTAFTDALVERAIKVGIPMSEIRDFGSEKLLSATVGRLESVQKNNDGKATPAGAEGKPGETESADDPMAAIDAIPDLVGDDFDPKLVKAFSALKGVAKAQAKELVELRAQGSKDFMARKLEGVKEFTKGDQTKESAVRAKFDALKAGYRATKTEVSDESVFAEAAQLVLGGDMKAKADQKKAEAAELRSGQRIGRPAGQRVKANADPIRQTGDEVHARFFGRS